MKLFIIPAFFVLFLASCTPADTKCHYERVSVSSLDGPEEEWLGQYRLEEDGTRLLVKNLVDEEDVMIFFTIRKPVFGTPIYRYSEGGLYQVLTDPYELAIIPVHPEDSLPSLYLSHKICPQ